MKIDASLVEVTQHNDPDYKPLVDFESWRVAILNDHEKFRRENTTYLERHNLTDEVFVLLEGVSYLYIGDGGDDSPGEIRLLHMEKYKLYNVKRGVWHNVLSSPGTSMLIVENSNTSRDNSSRMPVTPDMLPV